MAIDDRFLEFEPETRQLMRDYLRTRDPALVSPVFHGILDKYLPRAARANPGATLASLNALGLESLALIQVVLDVEEALGVTLSDEEWRHIRTFDEAARLLERKVASIYNGSGGTADDGRTGSHVAPKASGSA